MCRFILWLVPTVEKFPRSQKFLPGDCIQSTALDVSERLVEATWMKARSEAPRLTKRMTSIACLAGGRRRRGVHG
jgi:hypothetical protein